jgi:hypothetical protein
MTIDNLVDDIKLKEEHECMLRDMYEDETDKEAMTDILGYIEWLENCLLCEMCDKG